MRRPWPTGERGGGLSRQKQTKQTTSWPFAPEALHCEKSRPVAGLEFSDCKVVVPAIVIPSHKVPLEREILIFFFTPVGVQIVAFRVVTPCRS